MWNSFLWLSLLSACVAAQRVEETLGSHWRREGRKHIQSSLLLRNIEGRAKNVIFFLGDGMGLSTVTAMRIYKGQKKGGRGEDEELAFDKFPHVSLSKTYGLNVQTSDSANTATAYLCGVKANYGTLGVDGRVKLQDCAASLDNSTHVDSVLSWAQEAGKWTGLITTTRVTHATPAGLYSHSATREWEGSCPDPRCPDIAKQLIRNAPGRDIRVIMGGGLRNFLPPGTEYRGAEGKRNDSLNLVNEWLYDKSAKRGKAVFTAKELQTLDTDNVDYLLGFFDADHLPFVLDRPTLTNPTQYPSLAEMTAAGIEVLRKNDEGYFLLVEGGHIDLAHHMNWAMKSLEEGYQFDKAIQTALNMTDPKDTLIIVTADHSHTFTMSGISPIRGTNILGLGGVSDIDNRTLTTVGYYNGPGYKKDSRERNLTQEETVNKDFKMDSAVPLSVGTHGAEDVGVYAVGPWAHLFHGVHDQSYIAYVMGHAACMGPHVDLTQCSSALSNMMAGGWFTMGKMLFLSVASYAFSVCRLS